MTARAAIILAAGQGTRMKSQLPKVLHEVGGRAMLDWAIVAAAQVGAERTIVVTGAHAAAEGTPHLTLDRYHEIEVELASDGMLSLRQTF